jgi:hypothetical protein
MRFVTVPTGAGPSTVVLSPVRLVLRDTYDGFVRVASAAFHWGGPLQPGDIILMHFRTDLRGNLEVALNAARAAGLQPAALEQYLTPA